jgi:hypothetical protein
VSGVVYAPVGSWWTLDAPSLRLPTGAGGQVSIWTVGEGPSVLLVPRSGGDHRDWLPLLAHLQDRFTLHALQPSQPDVPLTATRDVVIAMEGLGAPQVVADGDACTAVLEALGSIRVPAIAVLHASPTPDATAVTASGAVHPVGSIGDRLGDRPAELAARIGGLLAV